MNLKRQDMILEFEFKFLSFNNTLAYFLEYYLKKTNLEYSFLIQDKKTFCYINANEDELIKISDIISKNIPSSIFLESSSAKVVEKDYDKKYKILSKKYPNITPSVLKNYHDKNIYSKNEFDILSEILVFKDNAFVKVEEENFDELLNFCILSLSKNKTLKLKDKNTTFTISPDILFYQDFVMPTNIKFVSQVFVANDRVLNILNTYEKPIINLKLNAIYKNKNKNAPSFHDIKYPADLFIFVLLDKLYSKNISFVSVKLECENQLFKINLSENNFALINHDNFILDETKDFLKNKSNKNLALYSLICDEFNAIDKNIHLFLSKKYDDEIKLYSHNKELNLIKFDIPDSFECLKNEILKDEIGEKLMNNYEKIYTFPQSKIIKKNNFFTLFNIISKILFNKDANYLFECAKNYSGKKGVRIDFTLKPNAVFDISKFIRSGLSYKLAGADEFIISFGYFESFSFFLRDYFDTLEDEFENLIINGSLFHERFLDIFLLNISKKINICLSKNYALEV